MNYTQNIVQDVTEKGEGEKLKLITVMTPCFNEEENIELIYLAVKKVFSTLTGYQYRHLFVDNCSQDKTVSKIKDLLARDSNIQLIVNNRNFGPIRSPFYGLLQAKGDAVIVIAADLQEPAELIIDFLGLMVKSVRVFPLM